MQTKDIKNVKTNSNSSDGEITMVNNDVETKYEKESGMDHKKLLKAPLEDNHELKMLRHLDVPKRKHKDGCIPLQRRKLRKNDGKIHKESKLSNKQSSPSRKTKQFEEGNSDSFYNGAIIGSFLGAAISTVLTKFLTEGP